MSHPERETNISALLGILHDGESTYAPNDQQQTALRKMSMVALIGPTAVGKSSLVGELCKDSDKFHELISFTTRPPRPGEGDEEYRFLPHTLRTITQLAIKIRERELVQYAIHPNTGYIYGTELADFSATSHNIAPILSSGTESLRRIPFGRYTEISVVSSPDDWQGRFSSRAQQMNSIELEQRLTQSRDSLEWSLEEPAMHWVVNTQDRIDQASQAIRRIVDNPSERSEGRQIATQLHGHISRLLRQQM